MSERDESYDVHLALDCRRELLELVDGMEDDGGLLDEPITEREAKMQRPLLTLFRDIEHPDPTTRKPKWWDLGEWA